MTIQRDFVFAVTPSFHGTNRPAKSYSTTEPPVFPFICHESVAFQVLINGAGPLERDQTNDNGMK